MVERTPTQIVALGARQVGEVVCTVQNPELDLLPGTNVTAEIRSEVAENAITGKPLGDGVGPAGHRRLNVLFTRARRRVMVFSSVTADQVRIDETSHVGLVALRNYLHYVERGQLEQVAFRGRQPASDFEREVAHHLWQNGYECVAQLGVAGLLIDLAVRDPRRPDAWLLGIECDGATYHSAKSARERDRLRKARLEDLGWRIHRIWSPEWYKNPEGEVERLRMALAEAEARSPGPDAAAEAEAEAESGAR